MHRAAVGRDAAEFGQRIDRSCRLLLLCLLRRLAPIVQVQKTSSEKTEATQ